MTFLNFFLFLLAIVALLDPESDSGSGCTALTESGYETVVFYYLCVYCTYYAGDALQGEHPLRGEGAGVHTP